MPATPPLRLVCRPLRCSTTPHNRHRHERGLARRPVPGSPWFRLLRIVGHFSPDSHWAGRVRLHLHRRPIPSINPGVPPAPAKTPSSATPQGLPGSVPIRTGLALWPGVAISPSVAGWHPSSSRPTHASDQLPAKPLSPPAPRRRRRSPSRQAADSHATRLHGVAATFG